MLDISAYSVTRQPDKDDITKPTDWYSVWHDTQPVPYYVCMTFGEQQCSCPHWEVRIRWPGVECKHHEVVRLKKAWNEFMFHKPSPFLLDK